MQGRKSDTFTRPNHGAKLPMLVREKRWFGIASNRTIEWSNICHTLPLCDTELGDLERCAMQVFDVYASISFVSQKSSESSWFRTLGTLAARFRRPAGGRFRPPAALGAEAAARLTAAPFWASASYRPPVALAGCQSAVSGTSTRLETRRLVREAFPLHVRPHSMLFVRHVHPTKCLVIQRHFPCRERRRLPDPTTS